MPTFLQSAASPLSALVRWGHSGLITAVDRLYAWMDAAQQRHTLSGLSDHALRDIGLSRADVDRETRRSFWDIDGPSRDER